MQQEYLVAAESSVIWIDAAVLLQPSHWLGAGASQTLALKKGNCYLPSKSSAASDFSRAGVMSE